jgi:iron(III) transport system substrate-binding protein
MSVDFSETMKEEQEMKKMAYWETVFFVIILIGVFCLSNAIAAPSTQMTALEKKLYEAAKKEGKVIWWDAQSLKESAQFIKAFSARYPGVEVSYYEANAVQSDEKYFLERQAGRNPVDIIHVDWYQKYKQEGCTTNMSDLAKDSGFYSELLTKDFDAAGIEHSVKGVAYNTKLVPESDVPRSMDALLNPKWKGKIAMEYQLELFLFQADKWGDEKIIAYLKKLKEQNPIFSKGVTQTMTLLGAGEYYFATDGSLGVVLGLQQKGVPINFAPISPVIDKFAPHVLVKDAPHPNAARLFMHWLMSEEGRMMMDKVRMKGNPLPGTGTLQSKAIEKLGVKILVAPVGLDIKDDQERYRKVIGYSK